MKSIVLSWEDSLDVIGCAACATKIIAPADFITARRRDHASFFCLNGHRNYFPAKSDAEKEREEADRLRLERDQLKQQNARLAEEAQAAMIEANQRLAEAQQARAEAARVTKRATAGVCPCCGRTFAQLVRHMKAKHPDVAPFKSTPSRNRRKEHA
jgi:hypothetical protein